MYPDDIAIVGAGPAGSMLSYELTRAGKKVKLFDHRAPWEKPCAGMLGPGIIEEHPLLSKYPYPKIIHNGFLHISPRSDKTFAPASKPFPVVSRLEFGEFLIHQAQETGTFFIKEKVLNIYRDRLKWRITTVRRTYESDFLVGADGARSIVRKSIIGKTSDKHMSRSCGYLLDGINEKQCIVKYLDIHGFIWAVTRPYNLGVGIFAHMRASSVKYLFSELNNFIQENYPQARLIKKWTALIPMTNDPSFFDIPCCGDNWLLIGDAAGHVDPIYGEGIRYALKSAELASLGILKGNTSLYEKNWRESYGKDLAKRAKKMGQIKKLAAQFGVDITGKLLFNYNVYGSYL